MSDFFVGWLSGSLLSLKPQLVFNRLYFLCSSPFPLQIQDLFLLLFIVLVLLCFYVLVLLLHRYDIVFD